MSRNNPRYTTLEIAILTIIKAHVGAENAIRRGELLETLKKRGYSLDDRKMRKAIENLRIHVGEAAWLCSFQNGHGYFFAATSEELLKFCQSDVNRGWSIVARAKLQVKRGAPELMGQLDIQQTQ